MKAFAGVHLPLSGRNVGGRVPPRPVLWAHSLCATVEITSGKMGLAITSCQAVGAWQSTDRINPLRVKGIVSIDWYRLGTAYHPRISHLYTYYERLLLVSSKR